MNTSNYSLLFIFSTIIFFIIIQPSSSQSLINSTCKSFSRNDPNINFSFCTTSLQAAPASHCASLRGLGMISIRLVRYNVTDARCHVRQLLRTSKLDPYVRQCLSDCFDLFSDAIDTVKQAMRSYNGRKFDDANVQMSSVMEASNTCEEGFKGKKGVVSPLTKRNGDVFQLSAMALSVMRMVQTESG